MSAIDNSWFKDFMTSTYNTIEEYAKAANLDKEIYKNDIDRLNYYKYIKDLNSSGYAGVDEKGNIVDRREFPKATPVQENKLFNIPKPKEI